MHIDEWIEKPTGPTDDPMVEYAKWFLHIRRLPASMQCEFNDFTKHMMLFCIYKGEKYRCTGASRMGDIWLAKDHGRDHGYDLRVSVEECSNFTKE